MYCSYCGTELPEDSSFCPACGTAVEDAEKIESVEEPEEENAESGLGAAAPPTLPPEPTKPQIPVISTAPAARPSHARSSQGASRPSGKHARAGIAVASIAIAAVVVAGVLFTTHANRTVALAFETDGGSVVSAEELKPGEQATSPENPTKAGYVFDGWYSDAQRTQKVSFPYTVPENGSTVYAKWTKESEATEEPAENSDGENGESAGSSSTGTAPKSEASSSTEVRAKTVKGRKALRAYYKNLVSMNDEFHRLSKRDFDHMYTKGSSIRAELRSELDSMKGEIYDTLAYGYERAWTVAGEDVSPSLASVQDDLESASNLLMERWECLDEALEAVEELPESATAKRREKVGQNVLREMDMSGLYKRYGKLDASIRADLA